ncbi:MAG: hypothetical protein ACFFF9_03930 [Candidatus Thorarchaeota archaeon]
MVSIPVDYEAFQGKRRKLVALLCFMLSSAIIAGVMVYVDSYSMEVWNSECDVGPVALVAIGDGIDSEIDDFRGIPGISNAEPIKGTFAYLASRSLGLRWQVNTYGMEYSEGFTDTYPTIFTLAEGKFPENASEIAISVLVADLLYVSVGDQVNYSYESLNPFDPSYEPAIVTGIFEHGETGFQNSYYYTRGHVLFHESLRSLMSFSFIYADVDRGDVVPYDPAGSLNHLYEINEQIRMLDTYYNRGGRPTYTVVNLLGDGIEDYLEYLTDLRSSQTLRSGGVLLLELSVLYLAVNHIWNERTYEINMLVARGASRFRVGLLVNLEIISLAVLSVPLGFAVGVVASRFAIASNGFFIIDYQRLFTNALLISIDSIVYSVIAGVALPAIILLIHQLRSALKITSRESTGRLARITKALSFVRGDASLLALSILLLVALNLAGTIVTRDPFLYVVLSVLPFTLFFGMTSLAIKAMRRGAHLFSRVFSGLVGNIPATVGIRRIGKTTASSGSLIIVLVLAMSLGWNYAINDATLPYTRLNQSRFAIGGDLAFHLDSDESDQWESFIGNMTQGLPSASGSILSKVSLPLSTGTEGTFEFVGLNPTEYSRVGYDSVGNHLNESGLGLLLEQLELSQTGAIVTQDVAEKYGLSTGGVLRAFWRNETELEALEFTIIGVVDALPDTLTFSGGSNPYPGIEWTYEVGSGQVWVNREDIDIILSFEEEVENIYCMRVEEIVNATLIAKELLTNGWSDVLEEDGWVSALNELLTYISQDIYVVDRSTDTLFTMLSVGAIFGAFVIYAIEGVKARKREIALLRSMGAERNLVVKTQAAEMLVLFIMSVMLLGLFTPVLTVNSLLAAIRTYGGVTYVYPSPVTIITPVLLMSVILLFFIFCVAIFITVIAILSSRVDLSEALNSAWTESSPYVEVG